MERLREDKGGDGLDEGSGCKAYILAHAAWWRSTAHRPPPQQFSKQFGVSLSVFLKTSRKIT